MSRQQTYIKRQRELLEEMRRKGEIPAGAGSAPPGQLSHVMQIIVASASIRSIVPAMCFAYFREHAQNSYN